MERLGQFVRTVQATFSLRGVVYEKKPIAVVDLPVNCEGGHCFLGDYFGTDLPEITGQISSSIGTDAVVMKAQRAPVILPWNVPSSGQMGVADALNYLGRAGHDDTATNLGVFRSTHRWGREAYAVVAFRPDKNIAAAVEVFPVYKAQTPASKN